MRNRRAFTLTEVLLVLSIAALLAVVCAPVMLGWLYERKVVAAAGRLHSLAMGARAEAELGRAVGFRLEPALAWPPPRRPDGTLDPDAPLALARVVPLESPPGHSSGRAAIHPEGFPAGFDPPRGRLVLEQQVADADGRPLEPTAWAWNVRLGDRVSVLGREFVVCGPIAVGPEGGNVERFVTYDASWTRALDRGGGPAEFLLLVNGRDDDGDGRADNGWNGLDDDLDGVVDNEAEWAEEESWGVDVSAAASGVPYAIRRRPAPAAGKIPFALDGAVVDMTGALPGSSRPARSRAPASPLTGAVEVMFHPRGPAEGAGIYAVPPQDFGPPWHHLLVAPEGELGGDPTGRGSAWMVSIHRRDGRVVTTEVGARDPAEVMREVERGLD